jgi:ABC-2 type transport system permease protein
VRIRRYARLLRVFVQASISAQLEYRVNFIVNVLSSLATAGGAVFGLVVLYGDGQELGGWTYRESLIVVGLYTLMQGYIGTFLRPNLDAIGESIRTGTMDFNLLKPIDAQFLVSARNINLFRLTDIVVGVGLIVWSLGGIPRTTGAGIAVSLVLLAAALAMVYAIWFGLTTTAFWFVKVANLTDMFNGLFRAGQIPITAYGGWVRALFTFIVPIAFITTVPAEAMIGRTSIEAALGALVFAGVLVVASRLFWLYAIRSYTSASS